MSMEKISGAQETLHLFLSGRKDHCGDSIFTSFREFSGTGAKFISNEVDYISADPGFLHLQYRTVLLTAKKDKMKFCIGIEIVVC